VTAAVSHGGSNVYQSDAPSTRLLVGAKDGVAALERSGESWRLAERSLPGRHISSIVPCPDGKTVLAGAFFGAVYVSEDGGRTWEERSEGLAHHDVYSMAVKQLPDGRLRAYAGTEPANLYHSDDMGRHWTLLPALRSVPSVNDWNFPAPPHVAHTKFIRFSPSDPNVIYACIEQGALLRSDDLGESWREVNTLGFYKDPNRPSEIFYDIHKLLIDPRDPNKLFVSGGAGLYVSLDGGAAWERRMVSDWAKDVYPDGLVFDPRNPDLMFMSAAEHNPARWRDGGVPGYSGSRLYRSRDQGTSWELLRGGLPDRMQEEVGGLSLEAWDGGLQLFAATSAGDVWWSADGGDAWTCIAGGLGAISKKGHDVLLSSTPLNYQQAQPVLSA
jgi:photosystem II stability/assembly factor-like uncharacterized protein